MPDTITNNIADVEIHPADALTNDEFLDRLALANGAAPPAMICDAETLRLNQEQINRLAPILWRYLIEHRDSDNREQLVAAGSALRKYVAMLDVSRMGDLAVLLDAGHPMPIPLELELEAAKMIYRKFEANPSPMPDTQPHLAECLWEIARAYLNPRMLLRDKYATVASLSIEAIVAMRSQLSQHAVRAACATPFKWFGEMVTDDLRDLSHRWRPQNAEAADWCAELIFESHP